MTQIPQDRSLDGILPLAFEGYKFISQRCQRYQSDILTYHSLLISIGEA